jgi:hypothetical protein
MQLEEACRVHEMLGEGGAECQPVLFSRQKKLWYRFGVELLLFTVRIQSSLWFEPMPRRTV